MSIINIFFKSKWDLSKIKKKKFLLVDGNSNPFLKYYDKKDFNILHRRGEKINIRILIKCIFDLNVSAFNIAGEGKASLQLIVNKTAPLTS